MRLTLAVALVCLCAITGGRHRVAASQPQHYLGLGHTLAVTAAAWSPDGRTLATGSADHTVVLWDRATWRPRFTLAGHTAPIRSLAWSPDSRRLVSSDDGTTAIIWDAAMGQRRAALAPYTEVVGTWPYLRLTAPISSLVWQPDGNVIAGGEGLIVLWNARTGRRRSVLHYGDETPYQWSPDGRFLAVGGYRSAIALWDSATGRWRRLSGPQAELTALTWSPDGRWITGSDVGHAVYLWEISTGRHHTLLPAHEGWNDGGSPMAWTPDGRVLATGGADRDEEAVVLWDAASWRQKIRLEGAAGTVRSLSWSPDGTRLASGADEAVVLWDARTWRQQARFKKASGPVIWSPDSRLFTTWDSGAFLVLRDGRTGRQVAALSSRITPVTHLAWSPDSRAVAAGSEEPAPLPTLTDESQGFVRVWDVGAGKPRFTLAGLSGGQPRNTFPGYQDRLYDLTWSPGGTTIATVTGQYGLEWGVDRTGPPGRTWYRSSTMLWDAATGTLRASLKRAAVRTVWSPDGKTLATGYPRTGVVFWDCAGHRLRAVSTGIEAWEMAWSPDGKSLVTPTYSENRLACLVWDVATGHSRTVIPVTDESYPQLAWSPRGTLLAMTTDDRQVALWDTATGRLRRLLILQTLPPYDSWTAPRALLVWQPDGKLLAAGSPHTGPVKFWDTDTGDLRGILTGPSEGVVLLAWSPDGKTLACVYQDHTVVLWDIEKRKQRAVLRGHTGAITALAWSPDGHTLATGSEDGSLRLWDAVRGKERATFYSLDGGKEWLVTTPAGYFAASAHGAEVIQWRWGGKLWPAAKFRRRFERSDLVRRALR